MYTRVPSWIGAARFTRSGSASPAKPPAARTRSSIREPSGSRYNPGPLTAPAACATTTAAVVVVVTDAATVVGARGNDSSGGAACVGRSNDSPAQAKNPTNTTT